MLEFSTVKRTATGRWPEVWQSLGVPADKLTGKHVSCLGCGGADRFRIVLHDADGRWFCGQGGSPTGGD